MTGRRVFSNGLRYKKFGLEWYSGGFITFREQTHDG
jgi:hypothetical protein